MISHPLIKFFLCGFCEGEAVGKTENKTWHCFESWTKIPLNH